MTHDEGRVAEIWLPNAMILAVILRGRGIGALAYLPAAFAANVVANSLVGDDLLRAIGLSLANSLEVLVVWLAMRRLAMSRPDMEIMSDLAAFTLVAGLIAPLCAAFVAVVFLNPADITSGLLMIQSWARSDSVSLILCTPLFIIFYDTWKKPRTLDRKEIIDWTILLVFGTTITFAVFVQTKYPFLFFVPPVVVTFAFRRGAIGAAVSLVMIALISSVATWFNRGPITLVQGDLGDKLFVLQSFLAVSFAMGLPVAALLKSQAASSAQMRKNRDFSDFIIQNVGDVIFRTDASGRWTFLNNQWEALTGYSADESIGQAVIKLLHPDELAEARTTFSRIAAGEIVTCVLQQRFADARGGWHHIETTVRRVHDDRGNFDGTVGNIRNVNERIRQQRKLAESEARFRRMAEAAPIAIFRADADGQVTYVNKAWSNKLGLTVDEMLGRGWLRALVEITPFEQVSAEGSLDETDKIRRRVAHFHAANGSDLWIELVSSVELDGAGKIVGFVGAGNDITGQRQANAHLRESEEKLALLANNVTDGVFRLALDGQCLYASPSCRSLLGISPRALIGINLLDHIHPDDVATVRENIDQLQSGIVDHCLVAYRSELLEEPGQYVWLEANCGLVGGAESGQPGEIIASIRNIDQTKALEAELREEHQRAERAVVAKSNFLANMSHEIRTPMNGVIGFTELLLAGNLSPDQRSQVELIAESGNAMMQLLNDILDISKIDAGHLQVISEPVDLRSELEAAVMLMRAAAQSKGITVEFDVADDVPAWIVGDQHRLRQIVLNLIGNAVKFTDRGWVRVNAKVDLVQQIPKVSIAVSDSGIGIAQDRLAMIFDEFTQADSSTARKFGGTGLGLSISAQLAQMLGGDIAVTSVLREGTTFELRLPLIVSAAPESTESIYVGSTHQIVPSPSQRRVLIAEDHDINQQLILALLKRIGIDGDIACNGEEAIAMVETAVANGRPYRLVIMDVQMPILDGLEATRRLRAAGFDAQRLPIIALTANAYVDDIADCLNAGMQAHLSKPVRLNALEDLVASYVVHAEDLRPNADIIEPSQTVTDVSLTDRYQSRKVQTIGALEQLLRNKRPSDMNIKELLILLHKLAGTAGYFGDNALGDAAAQLENDLRNAKRSQVKKILAQQAARFGLAA